jgi:hypothetical protein
MRGSRVSVVSIATGYVWAGWLRGWSLSPGRIKNFLFSMLSRPALGFTQPPTKWVPGALSLGSKRPGHEADHSPSASAEVKKMWIYTSIPPYTFMAQCLISLSHGQLYLFTTMRTSNLTSYVSWFKIFPLNTQSQFNDLKTITSPLKFLHLRFPSS